MKILIVAMANSIHTARWISQITDQGWDIHLFPTDVFAVPHSSLKKIKIHIPKLIGYLIKTYMSNKEKSQGIQNDFDLLTLIRQDNNPLSGTKTLVKKLLHYNQTTELIKTVKRIKPDIIHSMHIQDAGYITLEAKKRLTGKFPGWIVNNWGSEIDLFSKISSEEPKIREVLTNCDYYKCECKKDIPLVKLLGFKGKFLPVIPNSGGIDFDLVSKLRKPGLISDRRIIMLKGYQNWAGRALVGLRALERCSDLLKGYRIVIYSGQTADVIISAELFSKKTAIETEIMPANTSHEKILSLHGEARISIGLSITDAISTSLLEAMVMGSFPIQSDTSCADEWFKDSTTGILVPPEDPEIIEKAIRKALTDDDLVNKAAELNYLELFNKLERTKVKKEVIKMYEEIVNGQAYL
ncbi:MAG: glycosyltransferase [Actinobacteria bacterium]|nr:glycosyltransferase [Actinomycetota bacterium]